MLKFFRKIRWGLLSNNRIGKYLIYAGGEIILVVIGILIALNLNNRNEQRKAEAKVELIFHDILEELAVNIEETEMPMVYFAGRDSTTYLVLEEQVSAEDYQYNRLPYLHTLTSFHNPVNLKQDAYNNLIQDPRVIPAEFNPILKDLNVLYNYHKAFVTNANKDMMDFINQNQQYGMRNHPWWYIRNETELQQSIEYKLTDWRYRNQVSEFRDLGIGNQLRQSISFRRHAIECYKQIAKLLEVQEEHESFMVDQAMAEELVGEWQLVDRPEITFTFFLKDQRLFSKNQEGRIEEIFCLPRNKIMESDLQYATITRMDDALFLKYNWFDLKKVQ